MKPDSCLTSPIRLGAYTLSNRIVIASKPQLLADNNLPQSEALDYYASKASVGLIITEPTLVTSEDTLPNYPGIYTHQQVRAWRTITETVRKRKGKIFLQLWYSQTAKRMTNITQSNNIISLFRRAAQNGLAAEFDGIEIYATFGHLIDKNYKNSSKEEEKNYHHELENKSQLLLAIVEEVASVWDEDRVGIKLAPEPDFLGVKGSSLRAVFYYLIDALNFYNIAYLHLTEPSVNDYSQTELTCYWLNLFHSVYSGTLIFDCQDSPIKARDAIIKYGVDLVSFNDLSKLSI